MKKMIAIIVVLAIIFIGMIAHKKMAIGIKDDISISEINSIEQYITKIYMWKVVTKEALPVFDNINEADELWIWEVVKRNTELYEMSYEQISSVSKELFGDEFNKIFPKEGTSSLQYDESIDKYIAQETVLDNQEDNYLLNNIVKSNQGYIVGIIEYIEDYSENDIVKILNLDGEEIGKVDINANEMIIQEKVKNNKDKLSKKKVYLKKENDKLIVYKVEKE